LPEEQLREVLAKEVGVAPADAFGMLERLGAESAGALVLQPEGDGQAQRGAQQLERSALSARIRQGRTNNTTRLMQRPLKCPEGMEVQK
jgi:serine/threonine-protein kinase HipA